MPLVLDRFPQAPSPALNRMAFTPVASGATFKLGSLLKEVTQADGRSGEERPVPLGSAPWISPPQVGQAAGREGRCDTLVPPGKAQE